MKNTELPFIRDMFEAIAPRYDLLNRLLSLRQDVSWRRIMVSEMNVPDPGAVLDAACGTADVPLEILRQKGPGVKVFGLDFSPGMLIPAKNKITGSANIHLIAGNAFHPPFRPETFDAVTIAFGIRNIADRLSVLKIFYEALKPGGMLLVLELATPPEGFLMSLYLFYFKKVLPLIGRLLSENPDAYQYLPDSVVSFPRASVFAETMCKAGFSDVKWQKLTMGVATLYAGNKG